METQHSRWAEQQPPAGALPCLEKEEEEGTVNGSRANIAFQTSCLKDVAQRLMGRLETDERRKLWWGVAFMKPCWMKVSLVS